MRQDIVQVVGLGKKWHRNPREHNDIMARTFGTGEAVFIKCPETPEGIEYFFNVYADATALHRQKKRKAAKKESRIELPEVAVEFKSQMEAHLVYDPNEILSFTHPHLGRLDGDLVERIDKAFYEEDFSDVKAAIVYDPSSKAPYRFIAVARRSEAAKEAIHEVPLFDRGSGEGQKSLWYPNQWHPERVTGKRYAVPSKKFMSAEPPEGMRYVAIEGMAPGLISDDVAMMVLACCADAFFPKE